MACEFGQRVSYDAALRDLSGIFPSSHDIDSNLDKFLINVMGMDYAKREEPHAKDGMSLYDIGIHIPQNIAKKICASYGDHIEIVATHSLERLERRGEVIVIGEKNYRLSDSKIKELESA